MNDQENKIIAQLLVKIEDVLKSSDQKIALTSIELINSYSSFLHGIKVRKQIESGSF